MLVLSRKKNEAIVIGTEIKVTVLRIQGNLIKLGIEAPGEIPIVREETLLNYSSHSQTTECNTG